MTGIDELETFAKGGDAGVETDLEKSYYNTKMGSGDEVMKWAWQFSGTPLYSKALECIQKRMQLKEDKAEFERSKMSYRELNELPGVERDRIEVGYRNQRSAFSDRDEQCTAEETAMEKKLVDYRLEKERQKDQEKGDYGKSETTAVGILEEFCKSNAAGGLPTNEPKLGSGPEEGGKVEGVGKTSGSGDAPSVSAAAPKPKVEKLSDDDEVDEDQVKPHKKPVETRKSLDYSDPNQRMAAAAHANAVAISELQKSKDIHHGVGIPIQEPAKEPEVVKSRQWVQGPESLVHYSDASDRAAVEYAKSDSFYTGGSPVLSKDSVLTKSIMCPACKGIMSKSLTACPGCGYGTVVPRVIPIVESNMEKSAKGPSLRPARRGEGLYLPSGIVTDNE